MRQKERERDPCSFHFHCVNFLRCRDLVKRLQSEGASGPSEKQSPGIVQYVVRAVFVCLGSFVNVRIFYDVPC